MSMQSEFVHTLEERAGLDEATAERVAQVAMDFSKEHASEFISQQGAEPLKAPLENPGETTSETTSTAAAAGDEAVGETRERATSVFEEEDISVESARGTAAEDPDGERHAGLGGLFSRLTGH